MEQYNIPPCIQYQIIKMEKQTVEHMEQYIISYMDYFNCTYTKIDNESDLKIIYDLLKNNIIGDIYNTTICSYYGFYYQRAQNYDLMKKYYLMGIEHLPTEIDYHYGDILFNLAYYYKNIEQNYDLMKKYYLMCIEQNDVGAMYEMANYYRTVEINYDLMKKYYLMGINQGDVEGMDILGYYYYKEKKYDLMKKYYEMAIDHGNVKLMGRLGYYYENTEKNYDLMKKYYLMAISNNHTIAMNNLANYYEHKEKNYDLMKKYYLMAITNNNNTAIFNLAYYYRFTEINYDLMNKYYLMGAKNNDYDCSIECSEIYETITQENINYAMYFYNLRKNLKKQYKTLVKAFNNNYMINTKHTTKYIQSTKISILLSKYNNICVSIEQIFMNYKQIMLLLWVIGKSTNIVPKHVKLNMISLLCV